MAVTTPRLRAILQVIAVIAPQRVKHLIYRRFLGWDIHPTAHFGLSLIAVDHLVAAEGVQVSHFNLIKGCDEVRLGVRAEIGPFNWISSPRRGLFPASPDRRRRLVVADEAGITMRHYISCSDEVMLEPFAVLGGLHSRIVTHGPDWQTATQQTSPVRIGHHTIVATNTTMLAGSSVPPRCIVGAGATIVGPLPDELAIYGGTPARKLKDLPSDAGLFTREHGRID
jgi:acetyltransferase-like isoleucine patch superfamily enzyme